ncbi:E3 ubiquitin-protein ligase [Pycnococcus provasolii]
MGASVSQCCACGGLGRERIPPEQLRPRVTVGRLQDVDKRKLKRLILSGRLAPCFEAAEEQDAESSLEECLICWSWFPSTNHSECCQKSVCTTCFLQVKAPPSDGPWQRFATCPFCNAENYSVCYGGKKSADERAKEREEEAQVEAAQRRVREEEAQRAAEREAMRRAGQEVEMDPAIAAELRRVVEPMPAARAPSRLPPVSAGRHRRRSSRAAGVGGGDQRRALMALEQLQVELGELQGVFDGVHDGLDIESVMLSEAIWLSLQDGQQQSTQTQAQQTQQTRQMRQIQQHSPAERNGRASASSPRAEEVVMTNAHSPQLGTGEDGRPSHTSSNNSDEDGVMDELLSPENPL